MPRPEGWTSNLDPDVDLGGDVYVTFTHHSAEHYPTAPNPSGGFLTHKHPDGSWCTGAFAWWRPESERGRPVWALEAFDPLTLSPSFRCHCGFHGFIKQGRWQAA